ncbi:hypothetical protein LINPERHAP1_LOCUS3981, partial [Linum perenne]
MAHINEMLEDERQPHKVEQHSPPPSMLEEISKIADDNAARLNRLSQSMNLITEALENENRPKKVEQV